MMEENIALLEARIRELEDPGDDSTIKLHPPMPLAAAALSQSPPLTVYQEGVSFLFPSDVPVQKLTFV